MLSHKTEIRVRYADTDQMQFVYNGKYLEYFEVGRTEMLRENGLPYSMIEKNGYQLPVLETHAKYVSPAYYDDLLIIESLVKEYPTLRIHIDYKIYRKENNNLVAEGFTEHVFIKKESKKAVRPPLFFVEAMKPFYQVEND
jgi:acyl-CoA thioester hydrolase